MNSEATPLTITDVTITTETTIGTITEIPTVSDRHIKGLISW